MRLRPLPYRPDPALAAALLPPPCARFAPNRGLSARCSPADGAQHRAGISHTGFAGPGSWRGHSPRDAAAPLCISRCQPCQRSGGLASPLVSHSADPLPPNAARLNPSGASSGLGTPVSCCMARPCPSPPRSCRVLLHLPPLLCRGWVLLRVLVGCGRCRFLLTGSSGTGDTYFAPGFGVTLAVTHFPHPLKEVPDGEATAASGRAAWELLTAIFHSIFGTKCAIR